MTFEEKVCAALQQAFPALNNGHFKLMKETNHPYWEQATEWVKEKSDDF